MEENELLEYIEPKAEEKAAVIAKLQSGNFTLSFSSLEAFSRSPRAFIAYKVKERTTTPAMILGEAVHCMLLEPDEFNNRFFCAPKIDASTVEGKKAWKKIYLDFCGGDEKSIPPTKTGKIEAIKEKCKVVVIDAKTKDDASKRARLLLSNRASRHILDKVTETEVFISDFEIAGIKFTGKIDGLGSGIIADVKNMPDASLGKCTGAIWGRKLHWQAHIYDRAKGYGNSCYILAVDGQGECSVHGFSESHLMSAGRQIEATLQKFKECIFLSHTEPEIWDSSQDFWLKTTINEYGINYL
jgi:hypothetical protein